MMSSHLTRSHGHSAQSHAILFHSVQKSRSLRLSSLLQHTTKVAAQARQLEPQQQQLQQQQQQLQAIPLCLKGRAVSILWDLDNAASSSLQRDLLPALQELKVRICSFTANLIQLER
jgi:hypothetical protein